jgi:hypothetical protein
MKKITAALAVFAAMMLPHFYATAVQAQQLNETFISITGSDSNTSTTCQPDAPCQTFDQAYTVTLAGGQIVCLDTGAFANFPFTIGQSVTLECHDKNVAPTPLGGVTCGDNAIVINAAGATVTLRNINLSSRDGTCVTTGISIQAAAVVNIEDCVIENFPQSGIRDQRSGTGRLVIRNTVLRNNGSSSTSLSGGINIVPGSGGNIEVSIDKSQISGNYFGIVADGTSGGIIKGTIKNSVVSGNTEDGIAASSSGSDAWFLVDQTELSGNAYGLAAGGSGAEILARNSSVFDNTTGLHTSNGGTIYTYGNNSVNGNATNGAFTGTVGLQ